MKASKVGWLLKANKVLIVVVLMIVGWFYWFQLRPSEIRKNCAKESVDKARSLVTSNYQKILDECQSNQYRSDCNTEKNNLSYQQRDPRYKQEGYESYYSRCLQERGLK